MPSILLSFLFSKACICSGSIHRLNYLHNPANGFQVLNDSPTDSRPQITFEYLSIQMFATSAIIWLKLIPVSAKAAQFGRLPHFVQLGGRMGSKPKSKPTFLFDFYTHYWPIARIYSVYDYLAPFRFSPLFVPDGERTIVETLYIAYRKTLNKWP